MIAIRKGTAFILAILVVAVTIVFLLALWEIIPEINFREIFGKFMWSVFTIFVSSVLLLFIFSVLYKGDEKRRTVKERGERSKALVD